MDATTLVELIEYRRKENPADRAVIFPDTTITYGELGDRVDAIASSLLALGTQPGDRVGYFLSDGPECLPLLFGIIRSGAIAVPLNNRFKAYELSKVVTQCGMNILFTSPQTSALGADYIGLIREAFPTLPKDASGVIDCAELPELRHLVSWDDDAQGLMARSDFLALSSTGAEVAIKPSDTAIIKYTSGTTGTPKGAMLSHSAILGAARGSVESRFDLTSDDVLWSALPPPRPVTTTLCPWGLLARALSISSSGRYL